jgi:hypothetical protein
VQVAFVHVVLELAVEACIEMLEFVCIDVEVTEATVPFPGAS